MNILNYTRYLFTISILALLVLDANADIQLYGNLAAGVEGDSFQNANLANVGSVQDFGSYLGLKGSNSIIDNTALVWQIEQLLDVTSLQPYNTYTANGLVAPNGNSGSGHIVNAYNTLGSGETFIGLNGNFGETRLGNLSNFNRSSMTGVDLYHYAYGANGLAVYSRTSMLLPTSIRYDSPAWNHLQLSTMYSFENSAQPGLTGIGTSNSMVDNSSGEYSGGIYSLALAYINGFFSAKVSTQITQQVGIYSGAIPISNTSYDNAYANRIELSYNQPSGIILGTGVQATSGYGYWGWPNSGGSMNNYILAPGQKAFVGLDSNQYQTMEIAGTLGYHCEEFTPKISYAYGSNMMYGGNVANTFIMNANQIPDSGYQQIVFELDYNVAPRTLIFVNYGEIWWGNTMQNIAYGNYSSVSSVNQAFIDQASIAVGLSYSF